MSSISIVSPLQHAPSATYRIEAFCRDDDGARQTALTVTCAIYSTASGLWWSVADGVWGAIKVANTLAQVSAANLPGVYAVEIDHADQDPAGDEAYYLIEVTSNGGGTPAAPTAITALRFVHDLRTLKISDTAVAGIVAKPVLNLLQLWRALKVAFTHNSRLDPNSMKQIFYKEDGVTVAMSFDTKDAAGASSIREVCRSERDA